MKIEALKLGNETYIPNHSIVVLYSLLHFQQSLNKNVASINTASKSSTYIHAPTVCQTRESNVHSAPRYSLELQSPIAFKDPAVTPSLHSQFCQKFVIPAGIRGNLLYPRMVDFVGWHLVNRKANRCIGINFQIPA